jgi:hypothetical protein
VRNRVNLAWGIVGAAAAAAILFVTLWIGIAHGTERETAEHFAPSADSIITNSQPYTTASHAMHLPLVFGPLPQPPLQLVNNGDFEAGRVGWNEYSTRGQALIRSRGGLTVAAHGGSWAASLGNLDNEISMLSQGIQISADHACLVYWQWTVSSDTCNADYGGIGVNGNWLDVFSLCSGTATAGWVRRQVSMTDYITNSVVINVAVVNDYSFPSTLYVDNISLQPTAQCANAGVVSLAETIADLAPNRLNGQPIANPFLLFDR